MKLKFKPFYVLVFAFVLQCMFAEAIAVNCTNSNDCENQGAGRICCSGQCRGGHCCADADCPASARKCCEDSYLTITCGLPAVKVCHECCYDFDCPQGQLCSDWRCVPNQPANDQEENTEDTEDVPSNYQTNTDSDNDGSSDKLETTKDSTIESSVDVIESQIDVDNDGY